MMFPAILSAQEFRAGILVNLTDISGAFLDGCNVKAVNSETNVETAASPSGKGQYSVSFLVPGTYKLDVTCVGFRSYVQDKILLEVRDQPRIDVKLQPGDVSTSVTVSADASLLNVNSASRGAEISSNTTQSMPLNGHNPFMTALLAPGTTFTARGSSNAFIRTTSIAGVSAISLSGSQPLYNEALLDGVPITGGDGQIQFPPPVEATQEFKVQTNSFDAEFGRFTGGVINALTKSGTNQYHGAGYDFFRNSILNARDFFAATRPQFGYNLFGAAIGGPISIPKLYNGEDRTFFFVSYEGSREGVARATIYTVPTAAQRAGDFSNTNVRLANGQTAPITIYDPATTVLSGSSYVRSPFPGNKIPINRLSSVALKAIAHYPLPNAVGDTVTGANNYALSYRDPVSDDGIVARVDHQISERNRLFGRFYRRHSFVGSNLTNPLNAINGTSNDRWPTGFALDDTLTISPTLIFDIRYGYNRLYQFNASNSFGFDASQLGLPPSYLSQLTVSAFPVMSIAGYTTVGTTPLSQNAQDSHELRAGLTKVLGKHYIRFGAEDRIIRLNNSNRSSSSAGSFAFTTGYTLGPNPQATSTTAGSSLASFLLGLPASGSVTQDAFTAIQIPYYGFYVQDDFRITKNLTINVGLRYEFEGQTTERYNRINSGFDPTAPLPFSAQAMANYAASPIAQVAAADFHDNGGLLFAGVNGQSRASTNQDLNNIAPRIGVSWEVRPGTLVRGGYGIFYGATSLLGNQSQGFSQTTTYVSSLNNGLTPLNNLDNPFPAGVLQPSGAGLGLLTNVGQAVTFSDRNRKNPRAQQYQFGVQHQFKGGVLVEAAYAGTKSDDLPVNVALNFVPLAIQQQARATFLSSGRNILNDSVPNPFFNLITSGQLNAATTTRGQLLYAFPQFTSVTDSGKPIGSSRYDSLQVSATKRLSKGLSFLAAYTFSKNLQQTGYLNPQDASLTKALASFDIPQRLSISGTWELPVGPDHGFLGSAHGILGRLIEHWQLNVIYTAQGGIPLVISGGTSTGRSARLPSGQQSVSHWFDTSAFTQTQTLQLISTSVLPDVRTEGRNNFDASLFKTFVFRDRFRLQFRIESFNLFNRYEFDAPNTTFGSSTFGTINAGNGLPRQLQLALRLNF